MPDLSYVSNYQDILGEISPALTAVLGVCSLALSVLLLISIWCIFKKAGEPGWAAIIPFYNLYVLFKIVRTNGWKFLLLLIPVANIVIAISIQFQLAKSFGKSGGFGFGLWVLPVIFYPILGFGKSSYVGPVK